MKDFIQQHWIACYLITMFIIVTVGLLLIRHFVNKKYRRNFKPPLDNSDLAFIKNAEEAIAKENLTEEETDFINKYYEGSNINKP